MVSPSAVAESKPRFRIVIVYDTFASGPRAKAELEPLVDRLKPEFELETELWEFEEMRHQALREQASREVRDSELLVISAEGSEPLPPAVRDWLGSLLPGQADCLAGLVALSAQPAGPVLEDLRQIAERHGIDFFCNANAVSPPKPSL